MRDWGELAGHGATVLSEGRNTVSLVDKKGADAGVLRFHVAGHGLFGSGTTGGHRQSAYGTSGGAAGAGATGLAAGAGTGALAGPPSSLPVFACVSLLLHWCTSRTDLAALVYCCTSSTDRAALVYCCTVYCCTSSADP